MDAFYLPAGEDEFDSTGATESPWDQRMQHGGPPAALLARAIELSRPDDSMPIARLTVDFLVAIPQGRMRTVARIVRPGRRVELVEESPWAGGKLAVTASPAAHTAGPALLPGCPAGLGLRQGDRVAIRRRLLRARSGEPVGPGPAASGRGRGSVADPASRGARRLHERRLR